jgi:hypothetical protein
MAVMKIFKKGERVTCPEGHFIGFISRDIFSHEYARSDDIVDGKGRSMHNCCVNPSEYDCPLCHKKYMDHGQYCIEKTWRPINGKKA